MKRIIGKGLVYFVTTVTNERKPIFNDQKACRILLITVEYFKTIFDYEVYGYCLMPDHFHIILKPFGSFDISFIMKMIKGGFSRKINKLKGSSGSIWQRRFFEEIIRNNKQLVKQIEYIHANPIKAGYSSCAEQPMLSSFAQYNGTSRPENTILEINRWE